MDSCPLHVHLNLIDLRIDNLCFINNAAQSDVYHYLDL